MNPAIRSHRILAALSNYQNAENIGDWPSDVTCDDLGQSIGCYRNPGPQGEIIGIYADGLTWLDNGHAVGIRFADIVEVAVPSGKESEGLLLREKNGRQILLPIRGQRGRFFDSMEVLRFLDRVMQDMRGK